jgi:hypothetical protein
MCESADIWGLCASNFVMSSISVRYHQVPQRNRVPDIPETSFLLKLHSRYGLQDCLPAQRRTLSRGFDPASRPTGPRGSYRVYRQLHGWILLPRVICAVGAHRKPMKTPEVAKAQRAKNAVESPPSRLLPPNGQLRRSGPGAPRRATCRLASCM